MCARLEDGRGVGNTCYSWAVTVVMVARRLLVAVIGKGLSYMSASDFQQNGPVWPIVPVSLSNAITQSAIHTIDNARTPQPSSIQPTVISPATGCGMGCGRQNSTMGRVGFKHRYPRSRRGIAHTRHPRRSFALQCHHVCELDIERMCLISTPGALGLTTGYLEKGTNCTISLVAVFRAESLSMPPSPSNAAIS